jgi:hypothetical protein
MFFIRRTTGPSNAISCRSQVRGNRPLQFLLLCLAERSFLLIGQGSDAENTNGPARIIDRRGVAVLPSDIDFSNELGLV